jgi:DNA-binding MarR family transcriptional regulator
MTTADQSTGVLISDIARLMRTAFDRRVRSLALTRAQWLVLTRLHRHPGASQTELAELMEIEKPSTGRLIDRLQAKGWVERRPDATDRRVKRIYLTREAERVHKRIWKLAEATVADALSDLTAREALALHEALAKVKQRLVLDIEGGPTTAPAPERTPRRKRSAPNPQARRGTPAASAVHAQGRAP